jgi:hypothetical protein
MARIFTLAHDLLALALLAGAVVQLALLPNFERGMLLFFIPPTIAGVVLLVNRADPLVLAACRLFLGLIATSVLCAELSLFLAIPKPQFPGIPLAADRVLTFYFVAYGVFLWIICPAHILVTWLRHWWNERPKRACGTAFLCTAWSAWLGTMATLLVCLIVCRKKFF